MIFLVDTEDLNMIVLFFESESLSWLSLSSLGELLLLIVISMSKLWGLSNWHIMKCFVCINVNNSVSVSCCYILTIINTTGGPPLPPLLTIHSLNSVVAIIMWSWSSHENCIKIVWWHTAKIFHWCSDTCCSYDENRK